MLSRVLKRVCSILPGELMICYVWDPVAGCLIWNVSVFLLRLVALANQSHCLVPWVVHRRSLLLFFWILIIIVYLNTLKKILWYAADRFVNDANRKKLILCIDLRDLIWHLPSIVLVEWLGRAGSLAFEVEPLVATQRLLANESFLRDSFVNVIYIVRIWKDHDL